MGSNAEKFAHLTLQNFKQMQQATDPAKAKLMDFQVILGLIKLDLIKHSGKGYKLTWFARQWVSWVGPTGHRLPGKLD